MNFSKLLLVVMLGLFSMNMQAQKTKVNWGSTNKCKSKFFMPDIIGEDKTGIYIKSPVGDPYTGAGMHKKVLIEKYDTKSKKKLFSLVVERPEIKKTKTQIERIVHTDDHFIGFSSVYFKKEKKTKLYAYTIDLKTGKVGKKKHEVFSMDVDNKRRRGDYFFLQSDDHSKLVVNHVSVKKEKVSKTKRNGKTKKVKKRTMIDKLKVYNSDIELLADKTEEHDMKEGMNYSTANWKLDNDGTIFHTRSYGNGEYFIVTYDAENDLEKWEEAIELPEGVKTAGHYLSDMHLHLNAKNDMVLVGYYVNGGKNGIRINTLNGLRKGTKKSKSKTSANTLRGMFAQKIDNFSKETVWAETSEFDKTFKNELRNKSQKKKNKDLELRNDFSNVKIVDKADGGIIFTGEIVMHMYYYDSDGDIKGERWDYGPVIAVDIENDGKMGWAHAINKRQSYYYKNIRRDDGNGNVTSTPFYWTSRGFTILNRKYETKDFFSYAPIINDGKLSIVYNDHAKNTARGNEYVKRMRNPNKAVAMNYEIDLKTGDYKKKTFFGAKDFDVNLVPKVYYQTGEGGNIVLFGKKRTKYKFGTIKVTEAKSTKGNSTL